MDFDAVSDKIFPWVKRAIPLSGPSGREEEALDADCIRRDFLGDLCIVFAIDREDHFELMQRSMLPPGMDEDALYALARKNLTERVAFTLTGTSYGGYGILAGGDHEAGALCLDFIWDAVASQAGEDLVIAVPAKDCLFMAVAWDAGQVEAMKAISRDIFAHGDRPLTETLFFCDADTRQLSVYGKL